MAEHKVRLTIRPGEEVTVSEASYRNLKASGLLVKEEPKPEPLSTEVPPEQSSEIRRPSPTPRKDEEKK